MTDRIVIVGAGEAGTRAALALRETGFAGAVTLVGGEPHPPYERPPLSKAVLHAGEAAELPRIAAADRFIDAGITFLSGSEAMAIDRGAHRLRLADGSVLPYDRLLLATGARARRLDLPGAEAAALHYLRRFGEADALRRQLVPGRHLVVIGGGFIGLEIAAAARTRDVAVTLVESAPRLLGRAVPADVARRIADRHEAEGVRLVTGARLEAIEQGCEGVAVRLADGTRIAGDAVLAGIGAVPETRLAEAAGLAIDNGIAVDARLATSDPDIFAAGDCCSFPHPLYDGRRIRLEAWRNAQDQGAAAAASMLGTGSPFAAVPWFWSDQYELTLQIAGLPDEGMSLATRPLGGNAQIDFHLDAAGRLVAAVALGENARIARELRLAEMLIAARAAPPAAQLADPSVRLKSLLG